MRWLVWSVLALAVVALSGTVDAGVPTRSFERGDEVRTLPGDDAQAGPTRTTAASLPVATPVRTARIPSLLATSPGPVLSPAFVAPRLAPAPLFPVPPEELLVPARQAFQELPHHEFYFTRAAYTSWGGGWGRRQRWATDYPKADRQFMVVLKRLTSLDAFDWENAVRLDDPELRRFPFLYALEVGSIDLSSDEVRGLRDYLNAGGFLMIDDFWGAREWAQFEYQMSIVFPGRVIQDLPLDHPIFDSVYRIDEVLQVPALGRGIYGRPTSEGDGIVPTVSGIFDDDGRLMVIVNWNTDLGDAWEHAENPMYPVEYSTYAFQVGVNTIIYGMSH